MSRYYIDGPATLGTNAQSTTIRGDITAIDTTTSNGDMVYANSSNILTRIGIGSQGQVLTVTAPGIPVWSNPTAGYGFSARKSGTQTSITSTPTIIAGWSTVAPGYDTTLGDFNTTTGEFTTPSTPSGNKIYLININVNFIQSNNSSSGDHILGIYIAGVLSFSKKASPNNTSTRTQNMSLSTTLIAGDLIDIDVRLSTDNGSTLTVNASPETSFSLVFLSRL